MPDPIAIESDDEVQRVLDRFARRLVDEGWTQGADGRLIPPSSREADDDEVQRILGGEARRLLDEGYYRGEDGRLHHPDEEVDDDA